MRAYGHRQAGWQGVAGGGGRLGRCARRARSNTRERAASWAASNHPNRALLTSALRALRAEGRALRRAVTCTAHRLGARYHACNPNAGYACDGVAVAAENAGGAVPDSWFLERGAWKLCPARGAFCIKGNRSTHLRAPLGAGQRGGSIQGTPPGGRAHEACAIASWWFPKLWLACWLKLKLTLSGSGLAQLCTIL